MALTRTTLSSAVAVDSTSIVVASATGFAADRIVRVDQEWMVVQKNYSSGTTIPVRRGQMGSKNVAHVASAGVVVGTAADDYDAPGFVSANNVTAGRPRVITSITADNSTVTHAAAGSDHVVILNGTSVINLTVPIPTTDMDGDRLLIVGSGTAAHVVTFTGGIGGEGSSYDVVTFNASGPVAIEVVACNAVWLAITQPAWTGTVTNVVAALA
jgi:hypothetical protein